MSWGQSLVELAACAPVVMLLALGAAASVQLVDAQAGLEAATQAAAAEAARAANPASAEIAANARFQSMVASYPLTSTRLRVTFGRFNRTDEAVATASGAVDISWAALVFPRQLTLNVQAAVPLESWRSHRPSP